MSENTKLWDILGRTDPAHTKSFTRGGGFKGTALKPMWSYRRMTEEFGPCGTGWGVGEPSFQVVPGPEGEVLVYCTASIWYGEDKATCYGVGGDKAVGKNKYGLNSDDEAFKKAFTDAVTNALKLIGVGADVHMGLFDDSKYVNSMKEEFSEEPAKLQGPRPGDGRSPYVKEHRAGEAKRDAEQQKRQVGINPTTGMATAHSLKKDKGPDNWDAFQRELLECETVTALTKLALGWSTIAGRDKWPGNWRDLAKEEINKRRELLINSAPDDDVFPGDLPPNSKPPVNTLRAG